MHDDLISITITNSKHKTDKDNDVSYCIHTFGYVKDFTWTEGRNITFIKAKTSSDAVLTAYELLERLAPDFVVIHNGFNFDCKYMAAMCADEPWSASIFEERRLGNAGLGVTMRFSNGTQLLDTLYFIDKTRRHMWKSLALSSIAKVLNLDDKLDGPAMDYFMDDYTDVSDIARYNLRDLELHVQVCVELKMCEKILMAGACSRSPIQDSVSNNTGVMTFCLMSSVALSNNQRIDLNRKSTTLQAPKFKGAFVVEPDVGVHKGVVMLDANSLYDSIMRHFNLFISTTASASTFEEVTAKVNAQSIAHTQPPEVDEVKWNKNWIAMNDVHAAYIVIDRKKENILGSIIKNLIRLRKESENEAMKWGFKILLVSIYGSMGSRHGIISSRTCAAATTNAGRCMLKIMIKSVESMGYKVVYGDTDSIFVTTGCTSVEECASAGAKMKEYINVNTNGTPFENIDVDVKGIYKTMVLVAKKRYFGKGFDGSEDVKGLQIVRKDSSYFTKMSMGMLIRAIVEMNTKEQMVRVAESMTFLFYCLRPPDTRGGDLLCPPGVAAPGGGILFTHLVSHIPYVAAGPKSSGSAPSSADSA